jgi:hypothetical protein
MKYTVERNWIDVLGRIWQPGIGPCGLRIDLRAGDMENIGEATRDNVERWLASHAGDFQEIIDFHAIVGEVEIDWASEDNEATYCDGLAVE